MNVSASAIWLLMAYAAARPSSSDSRAVMPGSTSCAQLIDQARNKGLIDDHAHDILNTGRILRNQQIRATTTAVYTPAIAARIIAASRALVAELFGTDSSHVRWHPRAPPMPPDARSAGRPHRHMGRARHALRDPVC